MLSLPLGAILSHSTFQIGHRTKTNRSSKTMMRVVRSIGSRINELRSAMVSRVRDVRGFGLVPSMSDVT